MNKISDYIKKWDKNYFIQTIEDLFIYNNMGMLSNDGMNNIILNIAYNDGALMLKSNYNITIHGTEVRR